MKEAHAFIPRRALHKSRWCQVCGRTESAHASAVTATDLAHISGRPCGRAACARCYVLHAPDARRLHPLYQRFFGGAA